MPNKVDMLSFSRSISQSSRINKSILRPFRAFSSIRSLTAKDEEAMLSLMNNRKGSVVSDSDTLQKYNSDWTVSNQDD